ncbi:MAG: hypothetical protein LC640_11245, partial [Frankia sp.]|nr:hypothetical protein [Frankia sp.]
SPVRVVVSTEVRGAAGDVGGWAGPTAALVVLTAIAAVLGVRACDWALRRPGDLGAHRDARRLRRRALPAGSLRALAAIDRRSVWRATPLRRGLLVLSIVPAAVAVVAHVEWLRLPVLPGVVASGAALLYGVNVFCLDAAGGLWLASLPHSPEVSIRAKTWVLAEVCAAPVLIAVAAAALRAPGAPAAAEATALASAVAVTTLTALATALHLSLTRPHRADLRGPRDAPAPPGAMAVYSVRLATETTLLGLLFAATAYARDWWLPLLVGLPLACAAALRVAGNWRQWARADVRARVLAAVAAG